MLSVEEVFPSRLKAYMSLAGFNSERLAKAAGCSDVSIRKYMCGKSLPKFQTVFAIACALGCTPNDLCGLSMREPKKQAKAE